MADFGTNPCGFKEAVTIEAQRIFDSCSDRDCLEDLEVTFPDYESNRLVNEATYAKAKCAEVTSVFFSTEPIPFNKGFYSVDITYTFDVEIELAASNTSPTNTVHGTATFTKKVILYGSDGGTKYFTSNENGAVSQNGRSYQNPPKATLAVADPIVLNIRLVSIPAMNCCVDPNSAETVVSPARKMIYITLGVFSIVSLARTVPVMVPAYDYAVPNKECVSSTESPCELFEKINFPSSEFFPKSLEDISSNCSQS